LYPSIFVSYFAQRMFKQMAFPLFLEEQYKSTGEKLVLVLDLLPLNT